MKRRAMRITTWPNIIILTVAFQWLCYSKAIIHQTNAAASDSAARISPSSLGVINEEAVDNLRQQPTCHQMLSITYRFKYSIQVANCRKRGFVKVPHYLDPNTKILELSSNKIKRLAEESFQSYPQLVVLHLDGNEIIEITAKAFSPLKNLEVLTLRDNYITLSAQLVPSAVFQPLQQLQMLLLEQNPLSEVSNFYFAPLRALRHLRLNGSTALVLLPNSLGGLHNLNSLDLSNCNLRTLHADTKNAFNNMSLNRLHLAGNPWQCDCEIKWLVHWFKLQPKALESNSAVGLNVDRPVCAGPTQTKPDSKDMINVALFDKATVIRHFACVPKAYPLNTSHSTKEALNVNMGDNVTLSCGFESDPKGNTEWYQGNTRVAEHWKRFKHNQTSGKIFISMLNITSVKRKDGGTYRCVHRNTRGEYQQIRELKIRTDIHGLKVVKITMTMLALAAFVIIILTITAVCIYCLYCRKFEANSRSRHEKQTRGRQRADAAGDDESIVALNPLGNESAQMLDNMQQTWQPLHCGQDNVDDTNSLLAEEEAHHHHHHHHHHHPPSNKLVMISPKNGGTILKAQRSIEEPFDANCHDVSNCHMNLLSQDIPTANGTTLKGTSSFRTDTIGAAAPAHSRYNGGDAACPIHGGPRNTYSPYDTRESHQTSNVTNYMYGTLPCRSATSAAQHAATAQVVAAATAAAANANYQPCPLHGDFSQYATLPAAAALLASSASAAAVVVAKQKLQQQQQQLQSSSASTMTAAAAGIAGALQTQHHPHHHPHKQTVSFAEPELRTSRSPSSSVGTISNTTYVRSSKVDDCIVSDDKAAVSTATLPPPPAAQRAQDDEGYSTAV